MGGTYSTLGEDAYRILMRKSEGNRLLRILNHTLVYNIKMDVQE
jgi:hypothetical protein